jgi:hypothetical protein
MMDARTKAVKSHRRRLRKRGLKRVEVQVPAREADVIRKAAAMLRDPTEATQLRRHLGFDPPAGEPRSALDVFAMQETLSPEGEALWEEAMREGERIRKDPRLNRLRDLDL